MPATRSSKSHGGRKSSAPTVSKPKSDKCVIPARDSELINLPTVDTLKAKLWEVIPQLIQLQNADVVTMEFEDNKSTSDRIEEACKYRGIHSNVLLSVFEYLPGDDGMKVCRMHAFVFTEVFISLRCRVVAVSHARQ